ncbi:hypothetical protein BK671_26405 [Pseudomonas fluorescens]|uniref:DUF7683 domain-containing protein n=1 Tax=Pseudomonas fluorescens TaxID=294 RepID=A0A423KYK3_PSEFL|nr:hypothetical protein BK671_26405 [Pseudomonas fluorescens]
MNHTVEAFDKRTDRLVFEIPVPDGNIERLRIIMHWVNPEDEIYGYDLDQQQIKQLEALIGQAFYDSKYNFQMGCHGSE